MFITTVRRDWEQLTVIATTAKFVAEYEARAPAFFNGFYDFGDVGGQDFEYFKFAILRPQFLDACETRCTGIEFCCGCCCHRHLPEKLPWALASLHGSPRRTRC